MYHEYNSAAGIGIRVFILPCETKLVFTLMKYMER